MIKIAVGMPSYMEADNISFVTGIVDKGLSIVKEVFKTEDIECAIYNMDNNSTDGTSNIFKNTYTFWPKISLNIDGLPGKGKGVKSFFNEVINRNFDIALLLDSDLKTIEPEWILKFVEPFMIGECDFISPLYERSRFEGSTTNHFAYPLIYSFFGKEIRQPIAGDFALSRRLIEYIMKKTMPEETDRYGIDIFETIYAIDFSGPIKQIKLTRKIHKPSFGKLEKMFPEVASAAIDSFRLVNKPIATLIEKEDFSVCINNDNNFLHRDFSLELIARQKINFSSVVTEINWFDKLINKNIQNDILNDGFCFNEEFWADILSSWFVHAIKNPNLDSMVLAKQLLPFFVFRTVYFWNNIINLSPAEIEKRIKEQAELIRNLILIKIK